MRNFIIIMIVLANVIWAGGVGTTGANYLKMGLGAKAPALGENYAALANDTSAVYWNPSGITQAKAQQYDFMQMDWIAGVSSKMISGIYPLSETDFIGGYLFLMDTPYDKETIYDLDNLNEYKETGDSFKNSASVIDIAYSRILSEKMSVGLGLKNIHEELAGTKSTGWAVDAGLFYKEFYPNLDLGASVQNIGIVKLRSDEDYPMTLTFGAAYHTKFFNRPLTLLSDIKQPNDNNLRYGVGAEYWLADIFALRGGYNSLYKFSFGVGLKLQNLSADYAYVPIEDLGVTHRISVGYCFDLPNADKAVEAMKEVKAKPVEVKDIQDLFDEKKIEVKEESKTTNSVEVKELPVSQDIFPVQETTTEPAVPTAQPNTEPTANSTIQADELFSSL